MEIEEIVNPPFLRHIGRPNVERPLAGPLRIVGIKVQGSRSSLLLLLRKTSVGHGDIFLLDGGGRSSWQTARAGRGGNDGGGRSGGEDLLVVVAVQIAVQVIVAVLGLDGAHLGLLES